MITSLGGSMKVNLYLNFDGQTEAAFLFYRSVFGGAFSGLQRFGDLPGETPLPEHMRKRILHIALPVGENMLLMGSDTFPGMGAPFVAGNNCNLSLHPDSQADADRLFAALAEQGRVEMPMQQMFWGSYYGACTDRFGVPWMVNYGPM